MKFYIRKLNAQELGYRGGRVRQAGRYILISKELQRENNFFPSFNNNEIEPSVSIGCVNNANNVLVYCEYVWHNGSGHKGKDLRLYLNENIDPLNSFFNKDDYLVFLKIESNGEDLFRMFRFNPADNEYNLLENSILLDCWKISPTANYKIDHIFCNSRGEALLNFTLLYTIINTQQFSLQIN